jgi:O-antigen ligase
MRSAGRPSAGHHLDSGPGADAKTLKPTGRLPIWLALTCSAFVISPVVASYLSAVLYLMLIGSLIEVAKNPGKHALQLREILIAAIFAAYFLIGAVRGLTAPNPAGILSQIAPNIVFLLAAPLLPVLRLELRRENWSLMLAMLAAGGVAVGIYAEYFVFAYRELFDPPTGNPLMLALFCGLTGLVLLEQAMGRRGALPLLHVAGFAGATAALWLTARRSVILAYFACMFVLILWNARRTLWLRLAAALVIAAAAVAVAPSGFLAFERFVATPGFGAAPAHRGSTGDAARMSMFRGGARAFLEHPFMGHGRQNAVSAANRLRDPADPAFDNFTHLHSAPLTEAVSGGLIGLSAFLAVLVTPMIALRGAGGGLFKTTAACLLFFALCSVINVGFYLDATSSGFVFAVCLLNALAAHKTSPPSAPPAS